MAINRQKSISAFLLLLLFLVVSIASPVYAAIPSDVVGTSYQESVNNLVELGILSGNPDGTYKPEDKIARAAVAKVVTMMLGLENQAAASKATSSFKDVDTSFWAIGYINVSAEKGLIKGSDGMFRPNDDISYAEILTILVRALGYEQTLDKSLNWPDNYVVKAFELGIVGDVKWNNVKEPATRGNVAKICWNAMIARYLTTGNTLIETNYPELAHNYIREKTIEEISRLKESVVLIKTYNGDLKKNETGSGSGVVLDNGVIVTNNHVLSNSPRYGISYDEENEVSGEYITSTVYYRSSEKDIALTHSPNPDVKPVRLGNSDNLRVGQKVVAIGSPLGLKNTVTQGTISAIRNENGRKYIQFGASVTFGSSGGALFDMFGNLIGITTATAIPGENFNFAIPINEVKSVLNNEDSYYYNYSLNKEITDAMEFTFNNAQYKFSNESYYNEVTDVYCVNFYADNNVASSNLFHIAYRQADFRAAFEKQLESIHAMIEAKGYKKYIMNIYSRESSIVPGYAYSYKMVDGVKTKIHNTFERSLNIKYSLGYLAYAIAPYNTIEAGAYIIKYNFTYVGELSSNLNVIWVGLCINQENYQTFKGVIENKKVHKAIAKEMAAMGKRFAEQYPEKSVRVALALSKTWGSKPENTEEDVYMAEDGNEYYTFRSLIEVYDIIGDDYNYVWYE